LVIHKSDRADAICANLFSNLPDDWCIATSPSAYMTRLIMVQWIKHFIARSGASLTSPKVLFLDGHDSHLGADALKEALDQGVYIVCLRSHASCEDQPNDNGFNCKFKKHYGRAEAAWRAHFSVVCPMTKESANVVMAAAYAALENDAKTAPTIVKAFAKCKLYPLSRPGSSS
jgi:hypothetical protein